MIEATAEKLQASREELLARLKELGCESERTHLRCWFGYSGTNGLNNRFSEPIIASTDPWSHALYGRILSVRGRFDQASALLSKAVECLPLESAPRSWRGELLFLSGDIAGSLACLNAAVRLNPCYRWAYIYRAAARFKSEKIDGAGRDLDEFIRLCPRSTVGYALMSILELQRGNKVLAEEWVKKALSCGHHEWVYALRGMMRARWSDLSNARRDMDISLRKEESPWARFERAQILNKLGDFHSALKDLKAVSAALPLSPEPHVKAAAIYLDQAQYPRAVRSLAGASRLAPKDSSIYRARARINFVQGRLSEAQRDVRQACRLAPTDYYLRQEYIQLLIIRGFLVEALEALEKERFPAGVKEFWLGYIKCRQKYFAQAEKYFGQADLLTAGGGDDLCEKARFYRLVCRILKDLPKNAPPREKELFLIGLGYRHPFQISVGALQALSSCEVIYSNLSDPKVTDFLGLFEAPYRAIVYRGLHSQATCSARTVMAGFKRFKRIAMVTRGQPIIYGRLAYHLVENARLRGIPCRVPSSVSIFETILSLARDGAGESLGLQIRDGKYVEEIDPRLPLVVYLPLSRESSTGILLRTLAKLYPQGHVCHLLPGAGDNEFILNSVPLSGLKTALFKSDPACTLYVPGLNEPKITA